MTSALLFWFSSYGKYFFQILRLQLHKQADCDPVFLSLKGSWRGWAVNQFETDSIN